MKTHTTIGERMLTGSPYTAFDMAATIAASHHFDAAPMMDEIFKANQDHSFILPANLDRVN